MKELFQTKWEVYIMRRLLSKLLTLASFEVLLEPEAEIDQEDNLTSEIVIKEHLSVEQTTDQVNNFIIESF